MTIAWTERSVTAPEAAILFHPDRRTPWAPSVVAHLAEPLERATVEHRLAELAAAHPILDARLSGTRWLAGSRRLAVTDVEPGGGLDAVLGTRFDLAVGPPVRIARTTDGMRLVVVAHHAALDGRALLMVAAALLGGTLTGGPAASGGAAGDAGAAGALAGRREAVRRLAQPGDRVAPSLQPAQAEAFVALDLPPATRLRVATLAAAAVEATASWNAERGEPWVRIGLTIPVGGPPVLGNVSTHRRVDLTIPEDVAGAVTRALAAAVEPPGSALTPARARLLRTLAPLTDRLSDSLLVSNLGRVALPGATAVDFFPQARGRSAVAIGACTVEDGRARLTLRARDLTHADAAGLLHRIAAAVTGHAAF